MFLLSGAVAFLLPPGEAKESKMEALTLLSQLSLFELELQQKQASFFCRCFVVFIFDMVWWQQQKSHHDWQLNLEIIPEDNPGFYQEQELPLFPVSHQQKSSASWIWS